MDEVNQRPSETFYDLKWAARLYAALYFQGEFSERQRQVLIQILERQDARNDAREAPDFDNEFHDEYGKPTI